MQNSILIFFLIIVNCFISCQKKETPIIYPRKIGVDSAYTHLINNDTISRPIKKKKVVKLIVAKNTAKKDTIDNVISTTNSTTDTLKISYGKANKEVYIDNKQSNTFVFNSDSAKKVSIKISTKDTTANLRINHFMSTTDNITQGPFKKEIILPLPTRGFYKFTVAENPSNTKSYQGLYKVEIKLLWK